MKKFKLIILALAFALPGLVFTSCNGDDYSIDLPTEIVGKWNYVTYSMSEIPSIVMGEDTIISKKIVEEILNARLPFKKGSVLEFKGDEAKTLVLYQAGVITATGKYTIENNLIVTTQFNNETPAKFNTYISGNTLALSIDKEYIKKIIEQYDGFPALGAAALDQIIKSFYFELKFGKVDETEPAK